MSWRQWSGATLVSVLLLTGCAKHERVSAGSDEPQDSGAPDNPSGEEPDAEMANPGSATTELVPAEAPFVGETQAAQSGNYSMISRVAAPIGSGASGEGTNYRMVTGVIALQEGQQ